MIKHYNTLNKEEKAKYINWLEENMTKDQRAWLSWIGGILLTLCLFPLAIIILVILNA